MKSRYEIIVDGEPWSYRAKPRLAVEAGRNLTRANPGSLVVVRNRANDDSLIINSPPRPVPSHASASRAEPIGSFPSARSGGCFLPEIVEL
jgi:hypothetical protein